MISEINISDFVAVAASASVKRAFIQSMLDDLNHGGADQHWAGVTLKKIDVRSPKRDVQQLTLQGVPGDHVATMADFDKLRGQHVGVM